MPEPAHHQAEVLVATTWECNLRCSYCFVQRHGVARREAPMSPALAGRVVDALDAALTHAESICLHLYGGEPLQNLPAVEALLAAAAGKRPGRFRFAVTTNGVDLPPGTLDLLRAGDFQVVLSIDGPAAVHDACRRTTDGAPTHARVLAFLDALRSCTDCWVRGSAVVRSGWALRRATAYLRTLPLDVIKAQAARLPSDSPLALSPDERAAYLADLEFVGDQVIAELEAGRPPLDDRYSNRVLQLLRGGARRTFCGAGDTTFGITPGGTILPCILLDAAVNRLGHIDDEPASWLEVGRRWQETRRPRPECGDCPALPLCGGGCPAMTPLCGEEECDLVRRNCRIAHRIYDHFRDRPERLLPLAGIT